MAQGTSEMLWCGRVDRQKGQLLGGEATAVGLTPRSSWVVAAHVALQGTARGLLFIVFVCKR